MKTPMNNNQKPEEKTKTKKNEKFVRSASISKLYGFIYGFICE